MVADRDGSGKTVLSGGFSGDISQYGGAPELCWRLADRIVFAHDRERVAYQIDVSSGAVTEFHTSVQNQAIWWLSISADAAHMVFYTRTVSRGIWLADLANGGQETFVHSGCGCWISPDGNRFTNNLSGHVTMYIRDFDQPGSYYKQLSIEGEGIGNWNDHHWSNNSNAWILWPAPDSGASDVWIQNIETEEKHEIARGTHRDVWIDEGTTPTVRITSFTAAPVEVTRGATSQLAWQTEHASSVQIDQGLGAVALSGTAVVTPAGTTTYTLVAEGPGGPVQQSATVTVWVPELDLGDDALVFDATVGDAAPPGQQVQVINVGQGELATATWEIEYDGAGQGWLQIGLQGVGNNQVLANQVVLDALGVGAYQATVRVTCANAASSPQTYQVTLTVTDQALVLTSIEVTPATATIGTTETVELTARALNQLGSPFAVVIDWSAEGGSMAPASSGDMVGSHASTFTPDGSVGTFPVQATSGAVVGAATVTVELRDTVAPLVAIDSPEEDQVVSGAVTVAGTASDDTEVARVQVQVDSAPFQDAGGTASWSFVIDTIPLTTGDHLITARAVDRADNEGTASVVVRVDNQLEPSITITDPTAGVRWAVGSTRNITWTTQNLEDVSLSYSIDDGATWQYIEGSVDVVSPNWRSYPWTVPAEPTTQAKILIRGYFDEARAESDRFEIAIGDDDAGPDTGPQGIAAVTIGSGCGCASSEQSACLVAVLGVLTIGRRRRSGSSPEM